ncbi:MAG: hypothetical protein KC912_08615 [Proteobacteria bacterium]|nr:hypothetical protein [Pseudomonadota bacterium]
MPDAIVIHPTDIRELRLALCAQVVDHLDDGLAIAHLAVRHNDEPVAVCTLLPLDPWGAVSSEWVRLLGPDGSPDHFESLVDASRSSIDSHACLWSPVVVPGLVGSGALFVREGTPRPPSEPGTYTAASIRVLYGLESVRKRPAMYIGSTDANGGAQVILEVVVNAIDEICAGHATRLKVDVDGMWARIEDDGRGIPVEVHPATGRSALEVVFCQLHASGTLDGHAPHLHSGLHGVGLAAVNALCEELVVTTGRPQGVFRQTFSRGRLTSLLERVGEPQWRGTRVELRLDPEIFVDVPDLDRIRVELDEHAAQQRIHASLNGQQVFYEGGLADWLALRDGVEEVTLHIDEMVDGMRIQIAGGTGREQVHSWANGTRTHEGGSHVDAVAGLGLPAVAVSVTVHDPVFHGRTRSNLVHRRVGHAVRRLVEDLATRPAGLG